jgi:hypothetical protein
VSYYPYGVVLTRGTTIDLRSRLMWCHGWSTLLAAAPKRGANRVIPQQRGAAVRPRFGGEVRAMLQVRIDGAYNANSTVYSGDRLANAHAAMHTLLDFLDNDDPCTVTVHQPSPLGSRSGLLQVEDPGPPEFEAGRFVHLTVDVTLPDGRLS